MPAKRIFLYASFIFVVATVVVLVGAYFYVWPIYAAKKSIEDNLINPETAKYKSVYYSRDTGSVCGLMDAKNQFGSYVGYSAFVVLKSGERMIEKMPVACGEPKREINLNLGVAKYLEDSKAYAKEMEQFVRCSQERINFLDKFDTIFGSCSNEFKAKIVVLP